MAEESYSKNLFTPKNILIYFVVAAVLYGLIYYLFLSKKGGYNFNNGGSNYQGQTAQPTATVPDISVTLNPQNNSAESGTAVLSDVSGKVKVAISLVGGPAGVSQPAHIHLGACPNPGAIKYPLANVVNGKSETILDLSLSDIKAGLPLAVNVHKSNADVKTYVACGDIH